MQLNGNSSLYLKGKNERKVSDCVGARMDTTVSISFDF